MKAWAFSRRPEAPARAEQIVQQMHDVTQSGAMDVAPDLYTYSTLIMCYGLSRQSGAPQRAEAILRHADHLHETGHLEEGPNRQMFLTLIKAWKRSREANKEERIQTIRQEMIKRFGWNRPSTEQPKS